MRRTAFALTFALLAACGGKTKIASFTEEELLKNPQANFTVGLQSLQNPDKNGVIDYAGALERFKMADQLGAGPKASFNAGWVAEQLGQSADAEVYYRKAFSADPTYDAAMFSLARVLIAEGKFNDAVEIYQQVAAKDPTNWDKANDVVSALVAAGRYDEALAASQEILRHKPDNAAVYRNLSAMYYAEKNYSLSQLTAEKALELNSGDPGVYNNMGVTFLIQGDEAAAIEKFKTALKIAPTNFEANMNLGFVALNSGDYILAKTCFDAATAANPGSIDAKLGLAVAQRGMKDYKAAEDLYKEIIAADPQYEAAYYNAATLNSKFLKDFDGANKYLDAFVLSRNGNLDPNHPVFAMKQEVASLKAAEDERKRIEAEKIRLVKEKEERDRLLLEQMATTIATTRQKLQTNSHCLDPASVEEVSMILEQAQVVVDEKDIGMAGDIQTLMDAYVPAVDEAIAGCTAAAPAPAPEAPAPEAPPAEGAAPAEAPAEGQPTPQ